MSIDRWPIRWNARWIWAPSAVQPVRAIASGATPPPETRNRFCYLRKTIELSAVPAVASARACADSRFILYVNGVEVSRGPARSIPQRLAWNEFDLAPILVCGRNVIAALVRFYGVPMPWWIPAPPSYKLGLGSFAFESPTIRVKSDRTWKAAFAPYRAGAPSHSFLSQPPIEILDGARTPRGWNSVGFDDSAWEDAVELPAATLAPNRIRIPVEPYSAPEAADIAPLTAIPVELREIGRRSLASNAGDDPLGAYPSIDASPGNGATAITYDAGKITLATPWLAVSGPAGAIADIYAGEDLRSDGMAENAPRFYASRYLAGGGKAERVEMFEAVGFRYLTVVARSGAHVEGVGAIERRYPRGDDARFECDDLRLNKIWTVGARTLDLCSTDAFIDCPGREQRAWVGDSYIHALVSFVANTDWRLVRRHLRLCAHSARADGLLAMVAAGDMTISSTTIPDYSLHWVRALARYFEYSGDTRLARELAPTAAAALEAFERYRGNDGLIRGMPGWMFVDWAMTERAEVTGAIDALYAAALDDFAKLTEVALGDERSAVLLRERAARTRNAFDLLWDSGRGVYVDAADDVGARRRVSQQTNAIAIVSGCAPRDRWERILRYILDESRLVLTPTISDNNLAYVRQEMDPSQYVEFDAEKNVVMAQPFFSHLLHDALVRADRRELIASRCLKWWSQIERGNTAFEEYWIAHPGTGSRCHAWSATPTYDLTTHVLGVRPIKPGYAEAEIAPRFGPLHHLEGAVPTPRGSIEVALDRDRGGEIAVPEGIDAIVSFADAPLRGGRFGAGRHRIIRA